MAIGTCDYCGAGYVIPTPKSEPTWFAWWLCRPCDRADRVAHQLVNDRASSNSGSGR